MLWQIHMLYTTMYNNCIIAIQINYVVKLEFCNTELPMKQLYGETLLMQPEMQPPKMTNNCINVVVEYTLDKQ